MAVEQPAEMPEGTTEDAVPQADSNPEAMASNPVEQPAEMPEGTAEDAVPQANNNSPDVVTVVSPPQAGSTPTKASRGTKRRASASNTLSVEAVAAKIKKLEGEASSAK